MKTKKEIKKLKKSLEKNLEVVNLLKKSTVSSEKIFLKGLAKEGEFLQIEIDVLNWVLNK